MDDARKYAKPTYTKNNIMGDPRLGGNVKVKVHHYSPLGSRRLRLPKISSIIGT